MMRPMAKRKTKTPAKRGPGRPPLDPDGNVLVQVKLTQRNKHQLDAIVIADEADMSRTIRRLIEEEVRRRGL